MGKHRIRTTSPARIDAERFATNGQIAEAEFFRRSAEALNHLALWQRQPIVNKALNYASAPNTSATALYPAAFRTGETVTSLDVFCGLAWNGSGTPTKTGLTAAVHPLAGGAAVASGSFEGYVNGAGNPDSVEYGHIRLEGLSAKTAYKLVLTATSRTYVRCLSATQGLGTIYADDTTTGLCNPLAFAAGSDIEDDSIAQLVTACNSLWKYNGAPILSWSCDYEQASGAAGVPRTTASYANIIGTGVTFGIETQYRTTRSRGGEFPVEIAICYERLGGAAPSADGAVRFTDGTNTITVPLTGSGGVNTWQSDTASWPAQASSTGWEIQAISADDSFSNDHYDIYGVYVWPYEA